MLRSGILQQNTSVVNIYTWITPDGPFLTREQHSIESACKRTFLILAFESQNDQNGYHAKLINKLKYIKHISWQF